MRLIDPARSSQFVEWHNSGTTTLTHAICTPNVFFEFPEDQVTTNFIYPISSNFVAISHINYWDQLNSWKNFWKFWNGPPCRNKLGPSPLLNIAVYWQSSKKPVPRNCFRYLQTTLIMGEGGSVSEFMWGIVGMIVDRYKIYVVRKCNGYIISEIYLKNH